MPKKAEIQKTIAGLSEKDRDVFLHHHNLWAEAQTALDEVLDAAKEAGFTQADFTFAQAVMIEAKERKEKAKIGRHILIARFVGSDVDPQLNLFAEQKTVPEIGPAGFAPFTADEVSNY